MKDDAISRRVRLSSALGMSSTITTYIIAPDEVRLRIRLKTV